MESLTLQDFSQGWCPSDDALNGRSNGLLKMDSLELDQNGALVMSGGTKRRGSVYLAQPFAIFSKDGVRYVVILDGATTKIYRNNTLIDSGVYGSTYFAAFGVAYAFILICAGQSYSKDDGATRTNLGISRSTVGPAVASGGAGNLTGDYEYIEVVVRTVGQTYAGKSQASPADTITVAAEKVTVTPTDPTSYDAQANEVWIFRRGGDLPSFYRVKRVTSSYTTPFDDDLTDEEVLEIGIQYNEDIVSVNYTNVPGIKQIVGPVNGRHLYFTGYQVFFSEPFSPDSTNPGKAINTTSLGGKEVFCWAIQVDESIILVGTTWDVYVLSGTFKTLPDGSLDVTYLPLGVEAPPIASCVAIQDKGPIYMSNSGWVWMQGNQLVHLNGVNTDRLYRGNDCHDYAGVPQVISFDPEMYTCTVSKDKLYVRVPQIISGDPTITPYTFRMECYDFKRKVWRPFLVGAAPYKIITESDGTVLGSFSDFYLKTIDYQYAKTLENASTTNQSISFRTTASNLQGSPFQRKDIYTLKIRGKTGSDSVGITLKALIDGSTTAVTLGTFASLAISELSFDLSGLSNGVCEFIQFDFTGSPPDLVIEEVGVFYDFRPIPVMRMNLIHNELQLDGPNKKRVREFGLVIDTRGLNAFFVPRVDGEDLDTYVFNTTEKRTVFAYLIDDVIGIDFTGKLYAGDSPGFEFYGFHRPEILQALPVGRYFDLLAPKELFRYGTLKMMELRLLPVDGTIIPYTLYFSDASNVTGNLTVVDGIEDIYTIPMPKTTAGSLIKLELGPTDFVFHRIAARIQCSKTGKDTDMQWVDLNSNE